MWLTGFVLLVLLCLLCYSVWSVFHHCIPVMIISEWCDPHRVPRQEVQCAKVIPVFSMSSYYCKSCSFSTCVLNAFTTHAKVHKNVANHCFACGISECPCIFRSFQSFKSHVYLHLGKAKMAPIEIRAQPQNVVLSCQVEGCKFQSTVFWSFCAHLKWHIRDGKKVTCPYTGCAKYFQVRSTFPLT